MEGIYIFGSNSQGWYKIGMSKDVDSRLKDIQIVIPFPIVKIAAYPCRRAHLAKLEKYLHQKFSDKKISGEWFTLSNEDLGEIGKLVEEWKIKHGSPEPVKEFAVKKIKLSKEQKKYLTYLEQINTDLTKLTLRRDKTATRLEKLQKEFESLEHQVGHLGHCKKATEDLLNGTPPPKEWEQVFKTVYEHHYHYPSQPVIWPSWPYWQQPNYIGPYWWNTVTCQGNVNLDSVQSLVSTCGSGHLPGSSCVVDSNLSNAQGGSFTYTNSAGDVPLLPTSSCVVNANLTNSGPSSLTACSALNGVELSVPNIDLGSATHGQFQNR